MLFSERENQIFRLIKNSPEQYQAEDLTIKLGISERTIRNEIKAMRTVGESHGFDLPLVRTKGYIVKITDAIAYEKFLDEIDESPQLFDLTNPYDRVLAACFTLLTSESTISIEELAETLHIGRSTLIKQMDSIRDRIEKDTKVHLVSKVGEGLHVEGTENDIRFVLAGVIEEVNRLSAESPLTLEQRYPVIERFSTEIHQIFQKYHIYFVEESFRSLIIHTMVLWERNLKGFHITTTPAEKLPALETMMYEIDALFQEIFGIALDAEELEYYYVLLQSKAIYSEDSPLREDLGEEEYMSFLLESIRRNYQYDLTQDALLSSDLLHHIHSMLYRMKQGVSIRNPMMENIQTYYPLAFEITLSATSDLESIYQYALSMEEISYLALHIGASLERNYNIVREPRYSCLLVCGSGKSTARMLEINIQKNLPNIFSMRTLSRAEYEALPKVEDDLVLSTVPISTKNVPVFQIDPFPSQQDFKKIQENFINDNQMQKNFVEKFFPEALFRRYFQIEKDSLLLDMSKRLEDNQIISNYEDFLQSIYERESLGDTYLANGIAIPHPMLLMAEKSAVSIALLEHPIPWDTEDKLVEIVLLLAISKEDYEEAIGLYDLLVEIVRSGETTSFSKSKDYGEFADKLASL